MLAVVMPEKNPCSTALIRASRRDLQRRCSGGGSVCRWLQHEGKCKKSIYCNFAGVNVMRMGNMREDDRRDEENSVREVLSAVAGESQKERRGRGGDL